MFKKFIGIPFQHMGQTFEGCDCIGLVKLWHPHIDATQEYSQTYETDPTSDQMEQWVYALGEYRLEPHTGDIVLLGTNRVTHLGIYICDGIFIHSFRDTGQSEIASMANWFPYYMGCIRIAAKENDNG
jgi:cell wall-associated NlpC family hydrolase